MGRVSTREGRTGWLGRRGPIDLRNGAHCVYSTRAERGGRPAPTAAAEERELRFNPQVGGSQEGAAIVTHKRSDSSDPTHKWEAAKKELRS